MLTPTIIPGKTLARPLSTDKEVPRSTPQLLVSVRDRLEAEMALSSGVSWIDLKDPLAGPLGAPEVVVAQEVAECLRLHASRSVALGELETLEEGLVTQYAAWFPILKVGLSSQAHQNWQARLSRVVQLAASHGSCVVPVIYADWQLCRAPSPTAIVEFATNSKSSFVLIDTFTKNGQSLLHWMKVDELATLILKLQQTECKTVVAGSIAEADLDTLAVLPATALGVRGAVCVGTRESSICPEKLAAWVARFASA